MGDQLIAEVERTIRVNVKADIDQVCAFYAEDRKKFEGTDVEFVRSLIEEEAYEFLNESGSEQGDGFHVEQEWDETDTTFLGLDRG